MKKVISLFLILIYFLILFSCKTSTEKDKQKSVELVTAKTLGLAYLEEFKLEEAEKEFLKFIDLAPREKLGYANLGLTYLRMGKYPEAEKELLKALKIDPEDPDIRLILATVYQMNDKRDLAISQLKEGLVSAPDHIKTLYDLSELYSGGTDDESKNEYKKYLEELVEKAPANLVPRLNLTAVLIRDGETDKAMGQLEIIRKQFPEFPREATDYYSNTISSLKNGDKDKALLQFTIFHNYLKVTPPYQAGMMDLKGPGGSLIGFPLITFDQQSALQPVENRSLLEIIRFTDATSSAGLDIINSFSEQAAKESVQVTHIESADYDGDGDIDLYAGSYDPASGSYKHYLLNNEMGRFSDLAGKSGLDHSGNETSASFADFDNDGFLDLYLLREDGDLLYRNTGKGTFEDVTRSAKIGYKPGGNTALFFDLDHDGDLDLYETNNGPNMLFRNNSDGSFLEQAAKMGIAGGNTKSCDAAFGDFDEDGDIDFIVINEDGSNILYSNQRQGTFRDITEECGVKSEGGSGSVAVGDYNNDGFLDLFIPSLTGTGHKLYKNKNNGSFELVGNTNEMFGQMNSKKIHDAAFLDFDNDGLLDLLVVGEPPVNNEKAVYLYHNDGKGIFSDVSKLLPDDLKSGRQIALFDYNDDGDIDFAIAGLNGGVSLIRNDGGNNNHFVRMKLIGLRAGSAKNNHFGIGAKVEIRAGDLYQSMVVTDPNVHFGIGNRAMADVIRITWTNGVPQNIFFPATDQSLIEAQILKGSCPFMYTWDGDEFVFFKDVLWRSGLGMPLGIMGGNTAYAFPDASDDYIKIPGEIMKPVNGQYPVQVTSELWETIYLDKAELIAVDHPASIEIFVAEQFTPPPFPGFMVYQVENRITPVSAVDSEGNDVLPLISGKDDKYLHGYMPGKYQGITEMKDLILDPGNIAESGKLFLFMNGWIFPTDASINVAISQSDEFKVVSPVIQVINKKGEWETITAHLGFPMGKDKTVIADLSGRFLSDDHRIRIRTNMDIYWDQVFFADEAPDKLLISTRMIPVSADLHFRGFSEGFRKGGCSGPHWFDYSKVSKEIKWRDLAGNYTRFGDVLPLLLYPDNKYIISNAGDEVTIKFDGKALPDLKEGWKRDFLINFVGWVKDGDLNTAYGNNVMPLPFHGMKSYPPSAEDVYPDNPELQKYNREYNNRAVTNENYLNALKNKN